MNMMSKTRTKKATSARILEKNADCLERPIVEFSWHAEARILLEIGTPPLVLFVGDPGVGKTTFARRAAVESTGHEPMVLSGSPEVEQSHLFGRWTLSGDETRFVDGPLPLALKSDRWLVFEEFSIAPLEVRSLLLPLRDQSEITNPMTGEIIEIPPKFRLVATSNSESLTCRKNAGIAKVLFDGFYVLECGELTNAQVLHLLQFHFPQSALERRQRVLELWNEYREFSNKGSSGKSHLSYRAAEHLMRLLQAGLSENRAVQIALVNKFLPSDADLFGAANLKNSISE
ncbi:MAG TPA: AAA family ATPase [Planctomycetaceae bacterium]|nr:AAA family ATPase [Planctomycetaceae bacterium]